MARVPEPVSKESLPAGTAAGTGLSADGAAVLCDTLAAPAGVGPLSCRAWFRQARWLRNRHWYRVLIRQHRNWHRPRLYFGGHVIPLGIITGCRASANAGWHSETTPIVRAIRSLWTPMPPRPSLRVRAPCRRFQFHRLNERGIRRNARNLLDHREHRSHGVLFVGDVVVLARQPRAYSS